MLSHAGTAYFAIHSEDQEDERLFKKIVMSAQSSVSVRNNIAHGVVSVYFASSDSGPNGFCLQPQDYDSSKRTVWGSPSFAYTSAILLDFASEFAKLTADPHALARVIRARARASRDKQKQLGF